MASPSLVNSWEQPTTTPMAEPRRSPRISGGKPAASPATDNKENAARQRKLATPVGSSLLKRGLEARPSPSPAPSIADEEELPDEMNIEPSDSPAYKKSRPSSARVSRVSFGGVELRRFDRNAKGVTPGRSSRSSPTPAPRSDSPETEEIVAEVPHHPTEVSTVTEVSEGETSSNVSQSSNEEGFFSPGSYQSDTAEDATAPVPSLKDLLSDDVTVTITQGLTATLNQTGEVTVPVPRLSELGDFDDTAAIHRHSADRISSICSIRESMAPDNTAVIAANMLSRPSMAPAAMGLEGTPTATGPSLTKLLKRAHGEDVESEGTGSIEATSSADTSADDMDDDDGMEMTECYGGGIVQAAAAAATANAAAAAMDSPARAPVGVSPSLAAANMTTLNGKPPDSPNLKKLLREREAAEPQSPSAMDISAASDAPSIGSMIPANVNISPMNTSGTGSNLSVTPQLKARMRKQGSSMLAATADMALPSPQQADEAPPVASPALMRAGSRITMTASGASPSPAKPPHSPLKASPMQVSSSPVNHISMPSFVAPAAENDAPAAVAKDVQAADEILGNFEGEDEDSLMMPENIPEALIPSPAQAAAKPNRVSTAGGSGADLKSLIRRRSSVAPSSRASLMPVLTDTGRTSNAAVACDSFHQFLAIADVRFLEDMTTNRRNTMSISQRVRERQSQDLASCIALSTTTLPELRLMQESCDNLTNLLATSQEGIAEVEKAAEANPPALFAELAKDLRSEAATVIRGKLASLKRNSTKEAKCEWYTFYKDVLGTVGTEAVNECNRLADEEGTLVTRAAQYGEAEEKLRAYMLALGVQPLAGKTLARTNSQVNEVAALVKVTEERRKDAEQLEAQVAKLAGECSALQSRKDQLELSVEGLSNQKGYLMGNAKGAAAVSLEDASRAQQRYLAQLDIEGVVVRTIKLNEIVVDLCDSHRVMFTMEGDNVVEAQLKLFETTDAASFGEVDDFWRGLVEEAELESVVMALCGRPRSAIPRALCELSFRLGRCHDLKDEVNSIQRSLKVRSANNLIHLHL